MKRRYQIKQSGKWVDWVSKESGPAEESFKREYKGTIKTLKKEKRIRIL